MVSKKSGTAKSPKASIKKRTNDPAKADEKAVFPLPPPISPKAVVSKRGSYRETGGKITRVWGGFDTPNVRNWSKVPRMPNPWPPDDIVSLVRIVSDAAWLAAPLATPVYLLLKAWLDARASIKLKLRKGDVELELQGGWSERRLRKAFDSFRKLTKGSGEERPEVIDKGKVIPPRSGRAKYKIRAGDVEAARRLEKDDAPGRSASKKVIRKKG